MKKLSFTILPLLFAVIASPATSAHAAASRANACDRVANAAAQRWARQQGLRGRDFQITGYEQDEQGNSVVQIQLPLDGSNGDCWTNIRVTVQEHADDSCDAVQVAEDTAAESCS